MKIKKIIKHILSRASMALRTTSDMSYKDAEDILTSYLEAPIATCVGNNILAPKYDLQIVVPAYNVEKYIAECLDSVLQQRTEFSYIVTVVNDGSTDSTSKILEQIYSKNRDKMEVISQANRGLSGARNAGLQILKGRYITFLDSDDMLADGAIQVLMENADEKNSKCSVMDIVQGSWSVGTDLNGTCIQHATELSGFPWGKIYRAELFEHFQFPEGYWFEDTPISFILYGCNLKTKVIDNVVYRYRINPKGITATAQKSRRCVETYYITALCLKEIPRFGVRYDQRAYEYFLNQCVMNELRIKHRTRKIREAVFVLEAELKEQYFYKKKILSEEESGKQCIYLQNIEQALECRMFSRFELLARTKEY